MKKIFSSSVCCASIIVACIVPNTASAKAKAKIRYTEYGFAHISAQDFEGAGFGYGYAIARDNLCLIVEKMVTLAGERSKFLNPDDKYLDMFAGGEISNFDSDATYKFLLDNAKIDKIKDNASADMKALVKGYVKGFNKHVSSKALDGETCRSEAWFRKLNENDIWRRIAHVPLLEASSGLFREIAAASPNSKPQEAQGAKEEKVGGASNAVAFGKLAVEDGIGGQSFANPHYPWKGTERLHAFQMEVVGKYNVFGATAYGLPFPMLGFSKNVGWGITHTTDKRTTLYELSLLDGDKTKYRFGEKIETMSKTTIIVETKDGKRSKDFWSSRYGPMVMGEYFAWNDKTAYSFADPERENIRFADQFLAIGKSKNVKDIKNALFEYMGAPWSNVTASDVNGDVFYANITVAANITDAQLKECVIKGPVKQFMDMADVTTLNGSNPNCVWQIEKGVKQKGIIPPAKRPYIFGQKAFFNSNDSHWFAGLDKNERLEGYQWVIGPEKSVRGERTRIAAHYINELIEKADANNKKGASPEKWERLFFSSRNLTAELILDDLLEDCTKNPIYKYQGQDIDLTPACKALAAWDRRDNLDSKGSAFFGEYLRSLDQVPMTGFALTDKYWARPFDINDPINTPSGFIPSDETRLKLAKAALSFQSLGIALDAPLGDVQAIVKDGKRFPMSGSTYTYHMIRPGKTVPKDGIIDIRSGDSYIHNVAIKPNGVSGSFIVTYSLSTNPKSQHSWDMTEVFSQQKFIPIRFSNQEIQKYQKGETINLVE